MLESPESPALGDISTVVGLTRVRRPSTQLLNAASSPSRGSAVIPVVGVLGRRQGRSARAIITAATMAPLTTHLISLSLGLLMVSADGSVLAPRQIDGSTPSALTLTMDSSSSSPSPTERVSVSTTSPAPPPPPTPSSGGGGGGGGPTNSPLLFFVALGFGVVFTNLW